MAFGLATSAISRIHFNDPALHIVDLSGLYLTENALEALADAIGNNTYLRELDLSDNGLSFSPPFVALMRHVSSSRHTMRLSKLNLSRNKDLDDSAGRVLLEAAKINSRLEWLHLEGTSITDELRERIAFAISLNRFPRSLKHAAYDAREQTPGVYSVILEYDPSDVKTFNEDALQTLVASLAKNTQIRTFKADKCCRGETCLRRLVPLLQTDSVIKSISLRDNMLGDESAAVIVDALRQNQASVLEKIDLGGNEITDEGARLITELVRSTSSIKFVEVEGNPISDSVKSELRDATLINNEPRVLKQLHPAVARNDPQLEVVDLRGADSSSEPAKGYITSLGASTLASALLSNTFVHTLDLSRNHIGPDGAASLGKLLRVNTTLTYLDLSGNPLTDEGARHIIGGLARNDSIVQCYLSDCGVSVALQIEAEDVCRLNRQPVAVKKLYVLPLEESLPSVIDFSPVLKQHPIRGKSSEVNEETFLLLAHTLTRRNDPPLQELNIADNRLGIPGTRQFCKHILSRNFDVAVYRLSGCDLDDTCMQLLVQAVRVNSRVRTIIVSGNPNATSTLRDALENAVKLNTFPPMLKSRLPLIENNVSSIDEIAFNGGGPSAMRFGDVPVKLIIDALQNNTHVVRLVLQHHSITDTTVKRIRGLMLLNPTITEIDLSHNEITSEGAATFASLIANNQVNLRSLNLSFNDVDDDGAYALLEALHVLNGSVECLQSLVIQQGNQRISPAIAEAISCRMLLMAHTPARFRRIVASHGPLVRRPESEEPPLDRTIVAEPSSTHLSAAVDYIWDTETLDFGADNLAVDDVCCEALFRVLRLQKAFFAPREAQITNIFLDGQPITDTGLVNVCEAVRLVANITQLSLRDTHITADSAVILMETIKEKPSLRSVLLDGTPLSRDISAHGRIARACGANCESSEYRAFLAKFCMQDPRHIRQLSLRGAACSDNGLKIALRSLIDTCDVEGPPQSDPSSPSSAKGSVTSRFFQGCHVPMQQPLVSFAADMLTSVNVSDNPDLTDHGIAFLCRWLAAAAPAVQELIIHDTGITAAGMHSVKDFVWSTNALLVVDMTISPQVSNFFTTRDREVHDAAVAAAMESVRAKLQENTELQLQAAARQSALACLSAASEKEAQQRHGTAEEVLRDARGGDDPESIRRQADAVLMDALSDRPKREAYTRGKYRARVEARIADGRALVVPVDRSASV